MDRVLVVLPTHWDERHLAGPRRVAAERVEPVLVEPSDADCPDDLDPVAFVDGLVESQRGRIQGVFSSSDYPGATIAAAIATALGLPGSHPDTVMRSSHKYYSRHAQRAAAPEATPGFALVDPRRPDGGPPALPFPFFLKPVKGAFSVLARRIDGPAELAAFLAQPAVAAWTRDYMRIFNRLVARWGRFEHDGSWFLAEELLRGRLVTVEGFATPEGPEVLGVVDSTVHPETGSFLRFDYPSSLEPAVQERMADVARRVIAELGLARSMFNVEMMYDAERDVVSIVEVNPRICGQFADLYEKVDGVNAYEIALDLALGHRPAVARGAGPWGAAASFPLRVFGPARVVRAPDAAAIAAVEAAFPGTYVWSEAATGDELADLVGAEDGASVRYAVVNTGAPDREALGARLEAIRARLAFELEPLRPGA